MTCVKLKYVQQPVGKTANASSTIIRPSKRIIYDTTEAVVSFLSENVNTCVDEFLEEWAKVSKMVVIARESEYFFRGSVEVFMEQLQSLKCHNSSYGRMSAYFRSTSKLQNSHTQR